MQGSPLRWIDTPLASRIFATLLTLLASYFGYEKVEEYRASQGSTDVKVDVKVEAPTGGSHSHGTVLTSTDVKLMLQEAIKEQHKESVRIFKQKEPWENGGG